MQSRVVKRYAAALFSQARAEGAVDLVESDLGLITYTLDSVPSLQNALSSPLIPASRKREIARQVFHNKVHEITLFYLYLLIDKRREELIKQTEAEFIRLANEARGVTIARVTSAVELTEQEITGLRSKLCAHTGKQVDLQLEIDDSVIAGLMVRIGDTVIDGSIDGFLNRLKEQLLAKEIKEE